MAPLFASPQFDDDRARGAISATLQAFDATVDEAWTNPDGILRRLRQRDPVHWSDVEAAWIVTRHDDAMTVLRDEGRFSSDARIANGGAGATVRALAEASPIPYDSLLSTSGGADHARLRRAAAAAFAPAPVEELREPIRQAAARLLAAAPVEGFDFVAGFAEPLSLQVTLQLLGVEPRRQALVAKLADLVIAATQFGAASGVTREAAERAGEDLARLIDGELGASVAPSSLLASLLEARADGSLSRDDVLGLVVFVSTVGQAPTVFALGNAVLALLRLPDQLALVRQDRGLIANLLDEAVRFDPPVRVIRRFAIGDTALRGRQARAGDQVQVIVTAVNRDPGVFVDPNRFDVRRGARNHLGFGWSSHHCLGAPVARVIAEEGLALLLDGYPELAAAGRLELLTGETAGPRALDLVGRAGTPRRLLEAAERHGIVHRSVAEAGRNDACPCGSGRKHKHCHGGRGG